MDQSLNGRVFVLFLLCEVNHNLGDVWPEVCELNVEKVPDFHPHLAQTLIAVPGQEHQILRTLNLAP
jgi:hypothetical protein